MPKMPMSQYLNPSDVEIALAISEINGDPPIVYKAGPGETVEGPTNYVEVFERAGYRRVSDEEAAAIADRRKAEEAARAEAEAKAAEEARKAAEAAAHEQGRESARSKRG